MNFIKKNRILSIAIIIEILLLLLAAWGFFLPRFSHNMSNTEIPCNGTYANGIPYINESLGQKGFFTYGPSITLPRGVYRIDVYYSCDGNTNTVSCMADDSSYYTLSYDDITLNPDNNSLSFTLWANETVKNFQLTTIYGGIGDFSVSRVQIMQTYASFARNVFFVLLFAVLANLLILAVSYYKKHDLQNETILKYMALALLILFASSPVFAGYLTDGHDLTFHLMRIEGIKDGLLGGQFPVKIQPTQLKGYGYAASVFYGDLFLYIPAFLRLIGFTVQSAYQWYIVLVNIATVLICFYSMKGIFHSDRLALFGTALYSLCPYRLANIYGRAAVGEYTAMIFFPLLALSLYRIFTQDCKEKKYAGNWILPVIAYTGIIESHILSCEIVGIFTIVVCLIFVRRVFVPERFLVLCKIVIFTVLANLGFLIPLADYMLRRNCLISHGVMTASGISQSGLSLSRLFTFFLNGDGMPQAKSAFRQFGMQGEMGISVGFACLICFLVFLYFMLIKQKKLPDYYRLGIFAWGTAGVTLLMSLDFFPWDFLDNYLGALITSLQFPWRLLGISGCALAIVGCCALLFIRENFSKTSCAVFATLVLGSAVLVSAYMIDDLLLDNAPYYAYSEYALPTDTSGSPYNEYAPAEYDYESLTGDYTVSSDALQIDSLQKRGTTITSTVRNPEDSTVILQLPLFYFPGYKAFGEGASLPLSSSQTGLIQVEIPPGYNGLLKVQFKQPVFWIIGGIISAITVIYMAYILIINKKNCKTKL